MNRKIKKNLEEIIEKHRKWLRNDPEGVRADFSDADLQRVNLSGLDLSMANFFACDLSGANLTGTNLKGCTFENAVVKNAKLRKANMRFCNIVNAVFAPYDIDNGISIFRCYICATYLYVI